MTKKTIMAVATVLVALFLVGAASATSIVPDSEVKNIPIGGSVSFTLTLTPSITETGRLTWQTFDTPITAEIDGGVPAPSGVTPDFGVTANVPGTHTLTVYADSTAVAGQYYDVQVDYLGTNYRIKARVTPTVVPVPEMSTAILTSAGLLGLVGMVMLRRKD